MNNPSLPLKNLPAMAKIFFALCLCAFLLIPSFTSVAAQENQAAEALDSEIDMLAKDLLSPKDLTITINRHFLNSLSEQLAKASTRDLKIKILPSRVMSSKTDLGFAKYENYLDLESGDGTVDLRQASVENIKNGRLNLLIDLAGQIKSHARGKQVGFNYTANPEIDVTLKDQIAFTLVSSGNEIQLKPVAKQLVAHLNIAVNLPALGTKFNTAQDVPFDINSVLTPITLPQVIRSNFNLLQQTHSISLKEASYYAEDNRLVLSAEVNLQ